MANMRSCLFLLLFLYYIQVMTYCLDFPHGRRLLPFTRVENPAVQQCSGLYFAENMFLLDFLCISCIFFHQNM